MNTNESPYLTAKEAASYLKIAYNTFRKKAVHIKRTVQTKRYRKEDLDQWANSIAPRVKRVKTK